MYGIEVVFDINFSLIMIILENNILLLIGEISSKKQTISFSKKTNLTKNHFYLRNILFIFFIIDMEKALTTPNKYIFGIVRVNIFETSNYFFIHFWKKQYFCLIP